MTEQEKYIHLEEVTFGYTKGQAVIKDINLKVSGKSCTAVSGPNGGGKTTLGKLMAGILKP